MKERKKAKFQITFGLIATVFALGVTPYLFTYQKYPELNIPNTTNSLDGSFASLKELVGVHRGHNQYLKKKIIEEILGK